MNPNMNDHEKSNRERMIVLLNIVLNDYFENVPLEKVIKIADRLIEQRVTLPLVITKKEEPTADGKEVVRCGECFARTSNAYCQGRPKWWFCPMGKRKDETNGK